MYRDKSFQKNKLDKLNTGISTGLPCYSPTPRELSFVLKMSMIKHILYELAIAYS